MVVIDETVWWACYEIIRAIEPDDESAYIVGGYSTVCKDGDKSLQRVGTYSLDENAKSSVTMSST